ncbi:unnamed protein product [Caenorhabditis auriculariae]|uniref:Receptor expression-enhancing protein n=1 Tax=Caenorhabditis auriculariae TaxID=2777116 RepID=A0A8S1HB41_9PELO|nr:unnamed protein product [Caenorhabditis auriculariae]
MLMSFILKAAANLIGLIFPCYYSYKVLKKPTNAKLVYWLQYWIVYGAYLVTDWIFELNIIIIVIPQLGVAAFIHKKVLAPFLRQKEHKLDIFLTNTYQRILTSFSATATHAALQAFRHITEQTSHFEVQEDEFNSLVVIEDVLDESAMGDDIKIEPLTDFDEIEEVTISPPPKKRGRPRKNSKVVHKDMSNKVDM